MIVENEETLKKPSPVVLKQYFKAHDGLVQHSFHKRILNNSVIKSLAEGTRTSCWQSQLKDLFSQTPPLAVFFPCFEAGRGGVSAKGGK